MLFPHLETPKEACLAFTGKMKSREDLSDLSKSPPPRTHDEVDHAVSPILHPL
jgi:hypothetical protein